MREACIEPHKNNECIPTGQKSELGLHRLKDVCMDESDLHMLSARAKKHRISAGKIKQQTFYFLPSKDEFRWCELKLLISTLMLKCQN